MSKIKLTKGELKRQRDALAQFRRYLPTLILKKQQLQMRIREVYAQLDVQQMIVDEQHRAISRWVGLLVEDVPLEGWCVPRDLELSWTNIAGVSVPVLERVVFPEAQYDLYDMPLWVDRGIEDLRKLVSAMATARILQEQARRLEHELRVTTQRVNLFEKVKIPECQENIRVIRIYLGDQMANAVGIGKVAKKKLEMAEA